MLGNKETRRNKGTYWQDVRANMDVWSYTRKTKQKKEKEEL